MGAPAVDKPFAGLAALELVEVALVVAEPLAKTLKVYEVPLTKLVPPVVAVNEQVSAVVTQTAEPVDIWPV